MSFRRKGSGFSLIEVVVAFLLLALVLTASVTIFTWARRRSLDQTLWRFAIQAVEEEAETHRAVPTSAIVPGEDLPFLSEPVALRWLPQAVATRQVTPFGGDARLFQVELTLTWGGPDEPKTYVETLLVAR